MPPTRTTRTKRRSAPRPRHRLDLEERRTQLVSLGLAKFSTQTYDEVSIDDVAREANISKGLLYHYFPNKRDFYVACLREAASKLIRATDTDPSLGQEERSALGLEAYLRYVEEHERAYVALMRAGIGFDEEVSRICESAREVILARMVEGTDPSELPPLLRHALKGWIGFAEAAAVDWVTTKRIPREALRVMLTETLFSLVARYAVPAG
jgi:AcrR family transcriptional regulator